MNEDATKPCIYEWIGHCPICEVTTVFRSEDAWFRDHLNCLSCPNGSLPRDRAVMATIRKELPMWRNLRIHESSPVPRGTSIVLRRDCPGYLPSQFLPDVPLGTTHLGARCEDLERQTFADATFDLVVTQDVMEHVFRPELVHQEIWRTLKLGGIHIHTTPIYKDRVESERRSERLSDGSIRHLAPPEYHDSPVDNAGSLVTFHYGYDYADLVAQWAPFDLEIKRFNDRTRGIVAEFSEVIICRKRAKF
jgi:SAM-dependent methyltransferase